MPFFSVSTIYSSAYLNPSKTKSSSYSGGGKCALKHITTHDGKTTLISFPKFPQHHRVNCSVCNVPVYFVFFLVSVCISLVLLNVLITGSLQPPFVCTNSKETWMFCNTCGGFVAGTIRTHPLLLQYSCVLQH